MKLSFVGDIFFPKRCAACGKLVEVGSDGLFCEECASSLRRDSRIDERYPFRRIVSAYVYSGAAADIVRNMKHSYIPKTVAFAASEVLDRIKADIPAKIDVVTFVPRYGKRVPYSSSREMAKLVSKKLSVPLGERTVTKVRNIKSQTSCRSDKERRRNVSNAFRVTEDVRGKRVLVIDDVMTTGSTLREIGRILVLAGAEPFAAVFARTDLKLVSPKFVPVARDAEVMDFSEETPLSFSAFSGEVKHLQRARRRRRFKLKMTEKLKKVRRRK